MNGKPNARALSGLNRSRLPQPAAYFERINLKLLGRGEWRDAVCPFHKDTRPSLRVRLETGGFCCMACGAKGGDVIDFEMQRSGKPFVEACKALGAWEVVR